MLLAHNGGNHTIWTQVSAFLSRTRTTGDLLEREFVPNVEKTCYATSLPIALDPTPFRKRY